jgi:hypothetical protein
MSEMGGTPGAKSERERSGAGAEAGADDASEEVAGYRAVECLYHAYLTGLILATVMERGKDDAAELVFRLFRRQHLERFLPGLRKLGLDALPHAVACAQYHYLSNKLGGVKVEYIPENDRKAWVRYPPPRWIFDGTAICGIPTEVSRAMLRAWHAHNGVTLGNPRLGFVCTKQTVDGQPGLEGYYREADHDLAPEERLIFEPDEEAPPVDPWKEPRLESDAWPEVRLQKVLRNYAMEYIRNILPEAMGLFGPAEGRRLMAFAARRIGMQFYDRTARILSIEGDSPEAFARYLAAMASAQGDAAEVETGDGGPVVRCRGWRLMRGIEALPPEIFDAWNELWEGALSVHNRFLCLEALDRPDAAGAGAVWRIRRR